VEQSAAKKGIPPQQFVDEVSENFRELLDLMNISNDAFIRTTDEAHKLAVQVCCGILCCAKYANTTTSSRWSCVIAAYQSRILLMRYSLTLYSFFASSSS
jgi:methionyl-tRNA synthetase